jgi:transposase
MRIIKHVGLDVHAESISVAVASADGVLSHGRIPNDLVVLKKMLAKFGEPDSLQVVYEAGPTGLGLCRSLNEWGAHCAVIAPTLIPKQSGDRVKTDRRDAQKLAHLSFGGLLTAIYIPGDEQEALRDLVRAREAAKKNQTSIRHQLSKFLLRRNLKPNGKIKKWSAKYMPWVRFLKIKETAAQIALEEYIVEVEHQSERIKRIEARLVEVSTNLGPELTAMIQALQGFKGIQFLTAVTFASEIGDMMRFATASELMSYAGVVPREYSSGGKVQKGSITKSGNAHLRRVLGETAWSYSRGFPTPGATVKKRREGLSPEIVQILERADLRLRQRFIALEARGKHRNKVITAVGREMLGFIWDVARTAQRQAAESKAAKEQ